MPVVRNYSVLCHGERGAVRASSIPMSFAVVVMA
jgi:hypothetical protein